MYLVQLSVDYPRFLIFWEKRERVSDNYRISEYTMTMPLFEHRKILCPIN